MEKRKERINNLEETPHSQRTVLNLQRIMTKPSIFRYEGHNYLVPFLIISSLFFMWGFAHGILEVLNPHLLGARNRYALRLAGHQSPRQILCGMEPPWCMTSWENILKKC